MSSTPETVFIIDDDSRMRVALRALLKSVGIESEPFASAQEFLDFYQPARQGCALLDIRMPGMDGLELQKELGRRSLTLPIVFITGHADVPIAVEAMRRGAFDFLEKPFRDQALIDSVRGAMARAREAHANQRQAESVGLRIATLTPRERQVLELLSSGMANKTMATDLGLSRRTVEIHRANLMRKMGAQNVADLVRMVGELRALETQAQ
jgi:FixJ family two-component response regulator